MRYTRHNSPDLRSEITRENGTEKLFTSTRTSLPGQLNLNNTIDVHSRQLGDRRHLESTRFSNTSDNPSKDSTSARSYLFEQERRAMVRQQEQERLDREEREKERLEREEREKVERQLERRERERREPEYNKHDQDHNRNSSMTSHPMQPPSARHTQENQLAMPPPKAAPSLNWKTTLVRAA